MAMPLNPRLQLSSPTESIRYSEFIAPGVCYPQSKRSVCEPEPLSAPRTIVSPRLPLTMPTHQLIPPALCTRSHEGLRNEPNFARNRLQTQPICPPRRTRFHPNPTAMPPRHRQALFRIALYWHFPCSESASRLPPLVSCTSASKHWAAKPACAALSRPSES